MRILIATALAAASTLTGATFAATSASAQTGSYAASCRNMTSLGNGVMSAECSDGQGRFRSSTIQASACVGDIGNQGGLLVCNGAVAQGGAYVQDRTPRADPRMDPRGGYPPERRADAPAERRNDATGAVLGAVVGALFNNQDLYRQGYAYPQYGQRGYGDPRQDPRFAQGGWGYGAQGQWVPIARRADWLDGRIDQGQQAGTISRREARSLRAELDDLLNLERTYRRDGLNSYERAQLDSRFDRLAARIRFERRDHDNRPGYGGGYSNNPNGNGYNRGF